MKQSDYALYGYPFIWVYNGRPYQRSYNKLYCKTCGEQIEAKIIKRKDGQNSPVDSVTFNKKLYCSKSCSSQRTKRQGEFSVKLHGKELAIQRFCF